MKDGWARPDRRQYGLQHAGRESGAVGRTCLSRADRPTHSEEVGIPAAASWNIFDPQKTDDLIRSEQLDLVFLAKTLLSDPHWPYHAAQELGIETRESVLPAQYAHWLKRQVKPRHTD